MIVSAKSFHVLSATAGSWKLPVFAFALIMTASVWTTVFLQIRAEHRAMIESVSQEGANLALVFEQSADRTASEIDRMIRYLRASYERNGHTADWPTLVQEEFNANKRTVQIAIMDQRGMMITSSKMLYPKASIDLSDREHYLVHAKARTDRLFISQPVLGRASNRWSVQFTRPYFDAAGEFAGVIVVSLDPEFLTRSYSQLSIGTDGGLALVGDDGIVRAGTGIYAGLLGRTLPADTFSGEAQKTQTSVDTYTRASARGPLVTAARKARDFPLKAVITRSDAPQHAAWVKRRTNYIIGGIIVSLLTLIAYIANIWRRVAYERRLNYLARHDATTDLPNRLEFNARLGKLQSDPKCTSAVAVHMIDFDDFKTINDTHGHLFGDALLKAASDRLRDICAMRGFAARLGGDEFAVVQGDAGSFETVEAFAQHLCAALAEPYDIEGARIECTASIGTVLHSSSFGDQDELMRAADLALYAAKSTGSGTFRFYNEDLNNEALRRREVEDGLRQALAENQLEVHYQPIYDIATRTMTGAEALVRWRHPDKGMISPGEFIPVAERTGLIVELGAWVMVRACRDMAQRSDALSIAVNVSAIEFRDSNVADTVMHALDGSGLSPHRLKIEITESLLMRKDAATLEQLRRLREIGVRISMDDFGTGYSSLSYLQSYPIDCIKIDQSFVRALGKLDHAAAIIEAIASLARCMGMSTVAEGMETEEQYAMLASIGCREAQGFLLSRPKPIDEILPPRQNAAA